MSEQEAKYIIKRYRELVEKVERKLIGTVIPEHECDYTGGYEIDSLADLFIFSDGSIGATVYPYAPDETLFVSLPSDTFEEL